MTFGKKRPEVMAGISWANWKSRPLAGWLAVFGSAFCFYLATVIIRWSTFYVDLDTSYFVFTRFLLGFAVVSVTMTVNKQSLKPRRYHYLLGRTVANTIAVYCFYRAVDVTSVAEANILNMTYPLFVTILSWIFIREQRDVGAVWIVLAAFLGIWMVLNPGKIMIGSQSLWGLTSGFTAGFAMIYLNLSRRHHDSQTILFFMFGLGALAMLVLFREVIRFPSGAEFFFLATCSIAGVLGQYLLTYGFYYVTAVEGAVISSTRILLAALLGPLLVNDPALGAIGWLGALLLFCANVLLAWRKTG